MSMSIGELYSVNGQTEFSRILINGNSLFEDVARYRWNGTAWEAEILEPTKKIFGSGK